MGRGCALLLLAWHHSVAADFGPFSSAAQTDDSDLSLRYSGGDSGGRVVGQRKYHDCLLRIAGCAEGPVLPFTLDIACEWEGERSYLGSTMVLFAHYTGFIVCAPAVAFVIARIGIRSGMILPALLSAIAAVVCARLIRTGAGCPARRE